MYKQLWKELHPAICSINFYNSLGIRQTSMTGFKVGNYLITEGTVCLLSKYEQVRVQFSDNDGYTPTHFFQFSFQEFQDRIHRIAEYEKEGFALLAIEDLDTMDIPSLTLDDTHQVSIGDSVGIVGFHIDQENIGFHQGMVSSFYKSPEGKRYIQFDTAVHLGNSGSPLIDLSTGKVLGVVGYRLNVISKSYESLKAILDENLKRLKSSEGKMTFMDIDPIQVLVANQHQLKQISKEFYRSASLSYGCAHEIGSLSTYLTDSDISSDRQKKIGNSMLTH